MNESTAIRRGHWREISKHKDYDGDVVRDYECTQCGTKLLDVPDVWQSKNMHLPSYCWHCGARMDGDTK